MCLDAKRVIITDQGEYAKALLKCLIRDPDLSINKVAGIIDKPPEFIAEKLSLLLRDKTRATLAQEPATDSRAIKKDAGDAV